MLVRHRNSLSFIWCLIDIHSFFSMTNILLFKKSQHNSIISTQTRKIEIITNVKKEKQHKQLMFCLLLR